MFDLFKNNSILFRSLITFFFSFFLSFFLYKKNLYWHYKKNRMGEKIRNLGIIGEKKKEGIPTMGGVIMIFSILISTLLFASLKNIYIIILMITTLWMGILGFIDDYIKINSKKRGLSPSIKIIWQIILGCFIGSVMYFHTNISNNIVFSHNTKFKKNGFQTNIPIFFSKLFLKKKLDYSCLLIWYDQILDQYTWIVFIPIIAIIITFFSNGSNLTDGIDGLATGITLVTLFILSLLSLIISNSYYSFYFNFFYIPDIKETIIFSFSLIGTLLSFFWYNSYPAQIFMGDTGSLPIGAILATMAIINRIELILPILCGIFFLENISVVIQVLYFKYSKKRYGIEKKFFLMAPIHHHFQKLGLHENKIFHRFIIIQLILSIITLFFLLDK